MNDASAASAAANAAQGATQGAQSPGEALSRRCVQLLKIAMKPDVWPQQCELKLGFMDKIFAAMEGTTTGYGNACVALELLTFLLGVMSREQILTSFRPLQRGLGTCVSCTNSKVVRLMHTFLGRLMAQFPPGPATGGPGTTEPEQPRDEEFEPLYANVRKMISDGLANYEKNLSASPSSLFGTLMMLKAACMNNQSYIDRLITPFMKVRFVLCSTMEMLMWKMFLRSCIEWRESIYRQRPPTRVALPSNFLSWRWIW